ncbi:Argonaute complex, subunit Arb1 [Astrocystis sublimbata]|nr:Argonaute complex, subunit Arb1 [Astrocystis sublimbata]
MAKSKTAKSRKHVTGFEEFYADAPMTPADALEKKQIYDPARPFASRIEECIQRFRARRRFDSMRGAIFNKYLFLGGIDASQRQFTGKDDADLAEADTEQIRSMTAVDFVGGSGTRFYDGSNSDEWEVDFEVVVKGFLSRTMIDWNMYDKEAIQTAADLVKNFLNYVLMQDACPEYRDNIIAARAICDIAAVEFRYVHELTLELPGPFNTLARRLTLDQDLDALVELRRVLPQAPSEELTKDMRVVSTTEGSFQVLGVKRSDTEHTPTGWLHVKPTIIAHGWGNLPRPEEADFSDAETLNFVLENDLLAKFKIGMKIHMTVCKLNIGILFIKEVHEIRVSFDTFLPQYLMTDWKDPVPNERPPPSVENPNSEEKAMGADMKAED